MNIYNITVLFTIFFSVLYNDNLKKNNYKYINIRALYFNKCYDIVSTKIKHLKLYIRVIFIFYIKKVLCNLKKKKQIRILVLAPSQIRNCLCLIVV